MRRLKIRVRQSSLLKQLAKVEWQAPSSNVILVLASRVRFNVMAQYNHVIEC